MDQDDQGARESPGGWDWDPERNQTFRWTQVELPEGLVPDDVPEDQRFEIWIARFKSSSPDCELFLHDPLASLMDAGVIESRDYHVTTHVINHERTLSKVQLFASAIKSSGSVGLTLYKVAKT